MEKDLQLILYGLAAEHHLKWRPERLTLYNLTVNDPVSFAPAEKNARRALQAVRDVAAGIRAREFPARAGYACRYCDYRPLCPEHEQPLAPDSSPETEPDATEDETEN